MLVVNVAQLRKATKEAAESQRQRTSKLEALAKEHEANQRSLNSALQKQRDNALKASANDTLNEAKRLRAEFNKRQSSL